MLKCGINLKGNSFCMAKFNREIHNNSKFMTFCCKKKEVTKEIAISNLWHYFKTNLCEWNFLEIFLKFTIIKSYVQRFKSVGYMFYKIEVS